jgi:hypothetical protein
MCGTPHGKNELPLRCGKNLSCIERPQAITHHTRLSEIGLSGLCAAPCHAKLAHPHETTHQIERRTTSTKLKRSRAGVRRIVAAAERSRAAEY